MKEADRLTTEKAGISTLQLMENAAQAVLRHLPVHPSSPTGPPGTPAFLVLCGKGNNGGDGLAIARLLRQRKLSATVVLLADPQDLSPDSSTQWERWQQCGAATHVVRSEADWAACRNLLGEATHVVDSLLGVGLRGPVQGLLKVVISDVNRRTSQASAPHIVAVDIPSGLPADGPLDPNGVAIRAHETVTFTAPKPGLLFPQSLEFVGRLHLESIGTPAELLPEASLNWIEPGEFRALPLRRRPDAHKGDFGHVLVVAGSRGKAGAAALAASAALYAGAGLVTVATPESSLPIVAGHAPELMTEPLPETDTGGISLRAMDYARFERLQEGKSVLAIGPGLGMHLETQALVRALVCTTRLPVILDADGLNAFAGRADELSSRQTKLLAVTPHPGEMARLLGCPTGDLQARRADAAREAAAQWRCAVVLKGAGTIVALPGGRTYLNTSGTPWMASGGAGDVLTGALAGCLSQFGGAAWESALCFGVYCHGRAGELAAANASGGPVLASELLENLRRARNEVHSKLFGPHPDDKSLA